MRDLRFLSRDFNPRSLTGATAINKTAAASNIISIHAPSRERVGISSPITSREPFQSTLPHGSEPVKAPAADPRNISIHAPSRERHRFKNSICFTFNFNPRSLTGATKALQLSSEEAGFQSTLPHGSESTTNDRRNATCNFNPRSLTGAIGQGDKVIILHKYFNPRSLTGAISFKIFSSSSIKFQSTLPHGSEGFSCVGFSNVGISIHAPSRERDMYWPTFAFLGISIHAPSRERIRRLIELLLFPLFQSTLPHGSDLLQYLA